MTWHRYWLIWFLVTFGIGFLPAEIYALRTNWRNTLSAAIWFAERFVPGQSIFRWNPFHLALAFVLVWLFGHFILGFWR
jgi:hypothetical protein